MSDIPVVSLASSDAPRRLVEAWSSIGFVSIVDHGLSTDLIAAMRTLCRQVFALDDATKDAWRITRSSYRGFVPLGFFTPNRAEITGAQPDQYESFKLHWECPETHPVRAECHLYGSNRWLPELPQMRRIVLEYWHGCERIGDELLAAIAPVLGMSASELCQLHGAGLSNMTLLHYPEQPALDPVMGIHPHKDTNVLTLLHPDPVGGLEVRTPDGGWVEPEARPDALVVNTGEMLESWSGGRLAATAHRVINRSGAERYSFPWFLVPRHDVVVAPLVTPLAGRNYVPMPVGELSAEVWRTNWPDAASDTRFDLGSLDD
ncbi:MAG: 2OG-Fe(II) oxygenase family protein [Actinomycetota bacterium]